MNFILGLLGDDVIEKPKQKGGKGDFEFCLRKIFFQSANVKTANLGLFILAA